MRRICFWPGAALVVWLCWHYSFWAVFGWTYAVVSAGLIILCFTRKHQRVHRPPAVQETPIASQYLEFETSE